MVLLTKKDLPIRIETNKVSYRIKTDFRSWILFDEMVKDPSIEEYLKPIFLIHHILLESYDIKEKEQIIYALFSFYRMHKPFQKDRALSRVNGTPYRFSHDMDLILAAFRQQYQIDLLTAQMHWWEFKSLFDGLTEDTRFIKIVGYRTRDISKITDKKEREAAMALQKYYAIPEDQNIFAKTPWEIEAAILAKAKKGG